jgi:hypothetical protein
MKAGKHCLKRTIHDGASSNPEKECKPVEMLTKTSARRTFSSVQATFCAHRVLLYIIQLLGLPGNNMGVLDLYSRYDAPNRISNSRSSYTFTKNRIAGVNRMSTQSTNGND